MHPAILPAALAFSGAIGLLVHVALRREKTDLHWLLLALGGSLAVWTLGSLFRFSVTTELGLNASLRLIFLGVVATPPFWVLLAARYAGTRLSRRREFYVALMVPSALAYLALLTNEGHRLFIREVSFEALESGGPAWAGPVFWAFLAWAYACVVAGMWMYLGTARRMVANRERRRGLLLAAASAIPIVSSAIYMFGLMPVRFDLTPAGLVASLLIVSATVFRYRLLESLPLARRDVIEHLRDGVVIADAGGAILDLNPAAEAILGPEGRDALQRSLGSVLGGLARPTEADSLGRVLAELHGRAHPVALEIRTDDERVIGIHAASVRLRGGETAGHFAVLRDVTEERHNERVLRQVQRLETAGTLAAGVAHEVNNPLAFIRANLTQIHRMGERIEQEAEGPGAKLAHELRDLTQIAEETLDGIARIERIVGEMRRLSNGSEERFERVAVNALVLDALRLANLRECPAIQVCTALTDGLPPVRGAPQRLAQVLVNLLVNAKQALEETTGPRLSVETQARGAWVEIRIRDNGAGVPEDVQERIFDPFFTTKPPDRGSGLGLSIAFDIVRDHGGVLELQSEPGAGACFRVRLPGAPDASREPDRSAPAA